jgi:hypothetical protein
MMTQSRKALVMALLISATLPLISLTSWAQQEKWTDKQCRERMDQLFKDASDPTVDISEVTEHLGTRAATDFVVQCRIREKLSFERMERRLDDIVADRKNTAESEWRLDRYGRHQENRRRQAPQYDPFGMPTRT